MTRADAHKVIEETEQTGKPLAHILLTHGHYDHIGAVKAVREKFEQAKLCAHEDEVPMLANSTQNMSWFFNENVSIPAVDVALKDGDVITVCGCEVEVLHVPGHSPGSVCYRFILDDTPDEVFAGDVLFAGSVGRTDFPGGSFERLISGIRTKLLSLPDDTVLHTGHGESTTVGKEKRTNPFLEDA
ncbi:MAG: MBL fold metallo-hydrolase [Planctomycetota bacterium]|nr:MBL fold metallo-hydrolase [Planctomycetota bacterium]